MMRLVCAIVLVFGLFVAVQGQEEYCLRWNSPSVCYFQTVYPLSTDETHLDFYQYAKPFGASANTGLELADKAEIFLLKDQVGTPSEVMALVMIWDRPEDATGGTVALTFEGPNTGWPSAANDGANTAHGDGPFIVKDDPGEKQYYYYSSTESGSAEWRWWDCCTDGMSLGPVAKPTNSSADDWNIKVKFTKLISSVDADPNGPGSELFSLPVVFRTAPPLQATKLIDLPWRNGTLYPEMEIYPNACQPRPTCDYGCYECQTRPECGWCGATQTCHDRTCDSGFTDCPVETRDTTCPTAEYCGAREGCAACNVEDKCGICLKVDNSTGVPMTNETCIAIEELDYGFQTCDAGFNSTFAYCPKPPPPERNNSININGSASGDGEINLNDLIPAPTPGEGIPLWIFIAIGVAIFFLILAIALIVYKLAKVKEEVALIVAFEDGTGIKENPLFESDQQEGFNPLFEGAH